MNLSFAGCGFLGIYHVGVAVCFKKYAPHLLLNKISGASAGAIAACCLLCDLPIGEVASDMLGLIREARLRTLGPFSPSFNVQEYLLDRLRKVLPEDAHLRVNGKLHVSLTRVYDGKNVIVSNFSSKEDLLQALLASAFVPVFSGFLPPKFHGERYMDGGFSDNLPTLDENTITVSPFCGETDICPRDFSSQLFHVNLANTSIELSKQNIYRFARILWPPKPEVLSNMCKQGFDDALRFLHRNNLINCTRCLAVQSTFIESETVDECFEYDPQCQECKVHRQEALVANLPDTVMRVFQDAIDSANKGFYNWVLSHQGMKIIALLGLPYTVPADFAYAAVKKLRRMAPHMSSSLILMSKFFVEQLVQFMQSVGSRALDHLPTSSYQMEYSSSIYDQDFLDEKEMSMNFQINVEEKDLEPLNILTDEVLSRRNSLQFPQDAFGFYPDDDTFENILEVTSHHDAIMAFYYMDESNKVKVTEIFDVTGNDAAFSEESTSEVVQDDWDEPVLKSWLLREKEGLGYHEEDNSISDYSMDDECTEQENIFSDPESEWVNHAVRDENVSRINEGPLILPDHRPESEQVLQPQNALQN